MVSRVGLLSQRILRRRLDSNADVLVHVRDMLVSLSQTFFHSVCLTTWLDFVLTLSMLVVFHQVGAGIQGGSDSTSIHSSVSRTTSVQSD